MRRSGLFLGLVLAAVSASCARPFDSQSKVETLRILAIAADHSTPPAGTTVQLTMLVDDGSPNARASDGGARSIEVAWLGGCVDPTSDAYYACYSQLAPQIAAVNSGATDPGVGRGTTYSLAVPPDVVSRRGARAGTNAYGLSMVLYAVCAGSIVGVANSSTSVPPLSCVDGNGATVGADGFVFGFLPLYTFPGIDNQNPIINGIQADGATIVSNSCASDADCVSGQVCSSRSLCAPLATLCATRDANSCTTVTINGAVDPSSAEADPVATFLKGAPRSELLYVSYYATDGSLGSATKLVVDPALGPTTDWSTTWTPASIAEEVTIWAIAHDSRGGVAWSSMTVVVR
ncbi:MAG: hypothetical protein ACHREM_15505 [Polyangiales bacterium]